jgi:hypothetical protein
VISSEGFRTNKITGCFFKMLVVEIMIWRN